MIKIEISGGSAEEISTHISSLANLLSGTAIPAAVSSAPAPAAEQKATSRRRKAEPVTETVAETTAETPATEEPVSEPIVEETEVAAEEPTPELVAETVAEEPTSPNLEAFKTFDTAAARTWVIENYLNKYFNDQAVRTAKFKEIVSHFNYNSLTAVPAEKLVDVLVYVESKIAELSK
jgi:hypothetical protein